jgi:glycosyltransferase involved in cell wall biosynthesis
MPCPLFSIVVATYARPAHLDLAVASVLGQTVDDFECIVVDDAGSEPAAVSDDPRLKLLRRTVNGGPAAARNTGLEVARGRYVAFLDDDEVFTPDRLELALRGLESAEVALCWRRHELESAPSGRRLNGPVGASLLQGPIPHLGATVATRDSMQRFDERLRNCEDLDWWVRMAPTATVATVPAFGCVWRDRPIDLKEEAARRAHARLQVLEWHGDFFDANPRAAAYQWKRLGGQARLAGDRRLARLAFAHSLRRKRSAVTLWHLARASVA